VNLHQAPGFQALGVELLSVAPDPPDAWRDASADYDIPAEAVLLSDEGSRVAERYDVMQWQAATGEPGHTFVLVGEDGTIAWIRDYGDPDNGGLMYVAPDELIPQIDQHLSG
jgi:peroxiredoxin